MAKTDYRSPAEMAALTADLANVVTVLNAFKAKHRSDATANDTISGVTVYNLVRLYDTNFNINHARNGDDAKSGDVPAELKASKGFGWRRFMFHVMGDIHHPRFIFLVWDGDTLAPYRFYDISSPERIKTIHSWLEAGREAYLEKGFRKRDTMEIDERKLVDLFDDLPVYNIEQGRISASYDKAHCKNKIQFFTDYSSHLLPKARMV